MSYYLERIQRGVDFIEARLAEELPLADVAKAAGISQWHFQRMFKALTGETLKVYIRSRRLAASLDQLLTTRLRILDIALLAGFESQEAFARAFKQAFGITPQRYRQLGDRSLFLKKVRFDADYLTHINRNLSLEPQLYSQPAMALVGMRTSFYGIDSDKNNLGEHLPQLWGKFVSLLEAIPNRVGGCCYGIVRQDREDGERLDYHAAIEVSALGAVPEGCVALELPAAEYARFTHRGPAQEVNHTVNYVYSTWLAQSGRRHSYAADLEIYGSEYHPTSADSVIYYGIPLAQSDASHLGDATATGGDGSAGPTGHPSFGS